MKGKRRRALMEKAPKGWIPRVNPTGLFIRDYLKAYGEAYIQEIWRALKKAREERGLKCGSYGSFRSNYFYILRKLNLVEVSRVEKTGRGFPRVYYRIVAGKEDAEEWYAPQRAFDPKRGLGKRRYQKLKQLAYQTTQKGLLVNMALTTQKDAE